MILHPKLYLKNVKEIDLEMLKKHNIQGLILDVDNTLIDVDRKLLEGAEEWCKGLKAEGIKVCLVSNTNKIDKVVAVATVLDVPYITFAKKPSTKGLHRGRGKLGLEPEAVAVVGDQISTDVWGGNRAGMFTILVKPLDKRDVLITKVKRPVDNWLVRRYLKKRDKGVI
ncbi:MAG: YqeG family HAD IIIA-type phosphatase [Oscillospiraceae bacterium]|nr:YqeG family HAD IIIA-type phosphatase [Oscillospiraceae bacterium]